ncbi:MAG: DUF4832 domain-containing protein [Pseudomonadota bacterium]|nr:DUF4832 domain-containing protein [Pseudomonadota bacterium]
MTRRVLAIALFSGIFLVPLRAAEFLPARSSDDLSNPHKGYMLWGTTFAADGGVDDFYTTRIFHVYVPWREVETADQVFDWDGFEQRHITPISTAFPDATFVLRLVADYPDSAGSGIDQYYGGGQNERDYPLFLEQAPLSIGATNYTSCNGDGPGRAPDWNDADMIAQMQQLITAMAARYDGDARLTAVQVGLLGLWGEWHQTGCPTLEPGNAAKQALRDRYQQVFLNTPLQTRYARLVDVGNTEFGFHEDYFPSFTGNCNLFAPPLPLCDDSGNWNLEWAMANETPASRDNWQSHPLSGESPLASQKNVWVSRRTDIESLIRLYHLSFLGPAGKHEESGFLAALALIRRTLGYNLHLDRVELPNPLNAGAAFSANATLANTGSAPIYHDFALRLQLLDGGGVAQWSGDFTQNPRAVLPGASIVFSTTFIVPPALPVGSYSLRASLIALPGNRPAIILQSSGRDATGRVVLGSVNVMATELPIFGNGFE